MNDLSHHYNAAKALLDYFNSRQLSAPQGNAVLNWMYSQLLANVSVTENPDGTLTFDKPLQSSYNNQSTVPPEHGGQEATSHVVQATSDEPDYAGFPKPSHGETPHTDENMADRIQAIEIQLNALAKAMGEIMRGRKD